jgi:hypothetical protein
MGRPPADDEDKLGIPSGAPGQVQGCVTSEAARSHQLNLNGSTGPHQIAPKTEDCLFPRRNLEYFNRHILAN